MESEIENLNELVASLRQAGGLSLHKYTSQ